MESPRRFGSYVTQRFVDGVYAAPAGHVVHLTDQTRADEAIKAWGRPTLDAPVNLFALRGPGGVTLIDAGVGLRWGDAFGRSRAAMATCGLAPSDVRDVLLTHLHGDHALGLLSDDGGRYFPNARIRAPQADLAFFTDEAARLALPPDRRGAFDVAADVLAAYGDDMRPIAAGQTPAPGVAMIALPGHTPGHVGYVVGEGADALFIMGDVLHVVALQQDDLDLGFIYDVDRAQAAQSRRHALGLAAAEGWIVSGGHIDGFMRVEGDGRSFRLTPA